MEDLPPDEKRRRHYELEKSLARDILAAPAEERARIAAEAMDRIFREIPWHPLLTLPEDEYRRRLARKIADFSPWVPDGGDVLEMGCGKGELIAFLASRSRRSVGIDISEVILDSARQAPNLEFRVMDAVRLDFPDASFDTAISSQLIEHLHPDDVLVHFREVARVLRPGGLYVFNTPNRITGPHDVSRYFDKTATGFHLKESTYGELATALRAAGFGRLETQILPGRLSRGCWFAFGRRSIGWKVGWERLLSLIPHKATRVALCKALNVNNITIAAHKKR